MIFMVDELSISMRCPDCGLSLELPAVALRDDPKCNKCGSAFHPHHMFREVWSGPVPAWMLNNCEFNAVVRTGTLDVVYKALDHDRHRTLAIKLPLVRERQSVEDFKWFLDQAQQLAWLSHPSVLPINAVGSYKGIPYAYSEFAEIMTLFNRIVDHPLTLTQVVRMASDLARVLHFLHGKWIHADLNLANIILREQVGSPGSYQACILASCLTEAKYTAMTRSLTTPLLRKTSYMSPEQCSRDAHRIDARSDIYSVGIVLSQFTAGMLPLCTTIHSPAKQVGSMDSSDNQLLQELKAIAARATAFGANERYQTAAALADDLELLLT